MRTDHHHATSSSHIRPLTLGANDTGHADDGNPRRFDDTGRLTEQRTDTIVKALVKQKIGDRASCSLFVRAMEYQLTDYRHALAAETAPALAATVPRPAVPAAQATELAALARAAHELAGLLEALPDELAPGLLQHLEAQDEMRRGYDQRYLDQLRIEALRLAAACGGEAVPPEMVAPSVTPQAPAVSAAAVEFVSSLGGMYEECFEKPPTAAPDGAFARALGVLSDGISIEIPNDAATLELALGAG
jgi:hypothetical protein